MGYFDTVNWNKLKADVEKALHKGMLVVKKGAIVAKKKAEELTIEGERQYDIVSLKIKIHKSMSDLGARVYALLGSKTENPALDSKVTAIAAQIKKYERAIAALEKKPGKTAAKKRKKAAKKKVLKTA